MHTGLRADCSRCAGLCCVAPAFEASAEFAFDKPAGQACPNLLVDFRCAIHERLRPRGFAGCTAFDCQGAGQRVTQVTFGGRSWHDDPELAREMFNAFAIMRQLHELLWYLTEALTLPAARPLRAELAAALAAVERAANLEPDPLMLLDMREHRERGQGLLLRISELVRAAAGAGAARAQLAARDLRGRDLRHTDLRGADLRGAQLNGADLRGADLSHADLAHADLRAADVRGADLAAGIFLTQYQVNTANGDAATGVPAAIARPPHWVSV